MDTLNEARTNWASKPAIRKNGMPTTIWIHSKLSASQKIIHFEGYPLFTLWYSKKRKPGLLIYIEKPGSNCNYLFNRVGKLALPDPKLCKTMKNFKFLTVMAVVLTIFSACQKDELTVEDLDAQASVLEKPDVYSENGYLVFKSYAVADSISALMNQLENDEQIKWEKSLKFTSAKSYRYMLNEEILGCEHYSLFDQKVKEAASKGYFNESDSCMDYPFENDSWASILNKDGVVKIDKVLYSYDKKGGIAIHKGTLNLLSIVKAGDEKLADINFFTFGNSLKSVMLSNFGSYFNQRKWNGKYVLDVDLVYSVVKVPKFVYDPAIHDFRWVDMPDGVKYQFYCHQRVKKWYGWFDEQTRLYHKGFKAIVGGNYAQEKNYYYPRHNYSNSAPPILQSSSELANHYIELYSTPYPYTVDFVDQGAPLTPPVITNIDFDVWTARVGNVSDCIHMIIN